MSWTKEQRREYSRNWYHKNKDKRKEYLIGQRQRYAKLRRDWRRENHMKEAVANLRYKCKAKGIPFDIDETDIPVPTHCPVFRWLELSWDKRETTPSIDKKIPALGYVKGNVQVISMRANRIKCDATPDELIALGEYGRSIKQP